jgi:Tol biopolymer transport system component
MADPLLATLALTLFQPISLTEQAPERVSVSSFGVEALAGSSYPSISDDGRFVAFESADLTLVPQSYETFHDIFVHDRQTGLTRKVSVSSLGVPGDNHSFDPAISGDGNFVAFYSYANNLVPGLPIHTKHVYVHDLRTSTTTLASVSTAGVAGNRMSWEPAISFDGRFVAFESWADTLVPGDTNVVADIFVRDLIAGTTERVSVSSAGIQGNGGSSEAAISADGRFVSFTNTSNNLVVGDTNLMPDVFVHDRMTGLTTRVSVESLGAQGNGECRYSSLSGDGRYVGFSSTADNLVTGDVNGFEDVFVHDRISGATVRASENALGAGGDGSSMKPTFSRDGRFVSFQSLSSNLVAGHLSPGFDIFILDRQAGTMRLASASAAGTPGNGTSFRAQMAGDGRHMAFASYAENLVRGDANGEEDVFVVHFGDAVVHLAAAGSCPGPLNVTVWNATRGGAVALLAGPAGSFIKASPPCQGVVLDIGRPTAMRLFYADAQGRVQLLLPSTFALCGFSAQAVDLATCTVSGALTL